MEKCKSNRCIYIYEFDDNSVYIGLTNNLKKRHTQHLGKGPIYEHIKNTKLTPKLTMLTDYIDMEISAIKEDEYIQKYKSDGFNVLNKRKGGNLGGNNIFWTYEKCKEELIKYKTKQDAINYCPRAFSIYSKCPYNSSHLFFLDITKPNNYWTYEKCKQEASKYKTKKDFRKNCSSAFNISKNNKWFDDICSHMKHMVKPDGYWTYENCLNTSKDCISLKDFSKKYHRAYVLSLENDWLKDFNLKYTNHKKWTYDECLEVAEKCETLK